MMTSVQRRRLNLSAKTQERRVQSAALRQQRKEQVLAEKRASSRQQDEVEEDPVAEQLAKQILEEDTEHNGER
eukprot:gene8938-1176_t